MSVARRDILKGLGVAGGLTVFAGGYASTMRSIVSGWTTPEGKKPDCFGASCPPEATVDPATGRVTPNPGQYLAGSICLGCTSICGVRVRVDAATGRVLRVTGNPYHPLAASPPLPYETPLADGLRELSAYGEAGLDRRATACGRGNAVCDKLTDPYRVLTPLKRVGKRGEGRWKPISLDQLVEEIAAGGDLFGEGRVDGLASLLGEALIDPEAPELGRRVNQLAVIAGYANGRLGLAQRFAAKAFGTVNFVNHQGNCGLSMRAGYAALLGDFKDYPHLKPDYDHCAFYLSIGSSPANAGNPFMLQAAKAAAGRSGGGMKLVVVDPVLTNADSLYCGDRTEWVPIRPGTDGAFVMGMIRRIIESGTYCGPFLASPGEAAAKVAGEAGFSNAAHLVVADPAAPDYGRFLRARALFPEASEEAVLVRDAATGNLAANDTLAGPADLWFAEEIEVGGRKVLAKTGLVLLKEQAMAKTLAEYAADCGVAEADIVRLADAFAKAGRRAVADCHGGTMHAAGFHTAYAVVLLNALAGNLNRKGGASAGGGKFKDFGPGPRYNLADFPGQAKPSGVRVSRQGFPYEKTTEFKTKKEAGKSPYPAKAPWYPFSNAVQSEYLPSAVNAYPYAVKSVIFWSTNPVYGQAGLFPQLAESLADPGRIPLMVCVDGFMTETASLCDYVVPDVALYEGYGATTPWAGTVAKASSVAWPCVDSPLAKDKNGDPVCMETFFIALAKRLHLPGFGPNAIADAKGQTHPLERPEDFYHRAVANIAFDGSPVPEAGPEDLAVSGVVRLAESLQRVLPPGEASRAAFVYCRGGRFEAAEAAYQGDLLAHRYGKPLQIWNETVAASKNSMTGKPFVGTGTWREPAFCQDTPLRQIFAETDWPFLLVSTKSQLMSSGAVGSGRLHAIRRESQVAVNIADAARLDLATGDLVSLETPGGAVSAWVTVRRGVMRGVVAIEHGYGHFALGAAPLVVDGRRLPVSPERGRGVCGNLLGVHDPFRDGFSTLADPAVGANARNALPARLVKLS